MEHQRRESYAGCGKSVKREMQRGRGALPHTLQGFSVLDPFSAAHMCGWGRWIFLCERFQLRFCGWDFFCSEAGGLLWAGGFVSTPRENGGLQSRKIQVLPCGLRGFAEREHYVQNTFPFIANALIFRQNTFDEKFFKILFFLLLLCPRCSPLFPSVPHCSQTAIALVYP